MFIVAIISMLIYFILIPINIDCLRKAFIAYLKIKLLTEQIYTHRIIELKEELNNYIRSIKIYSFVIVLTYIFRAILRSIFL